MVTDQFDYAKDDHRLFKGKDLTRQIRNWSDAHQPKVEYISYQPVTSRANRRHFQDTRAAHMMSKKMNIPKEEQQPSGNVPFRNPARAIRKTQQRQERLARRG